MSHSRIFDEYAKIMSAKGLVKTADKKDEDYNTTPEKAGPDTKVEKSGYELVEIAHPEQVQVSESRLNDGIVENGVEQQKAMIDVALRNPRGVLASVMQTLVKAANILDAEQTEESLKLAAEIDDFLVSLAQQSEVVLNREDAKQLDLRRLARLKEVVAEVLNRFGDLDWSTLGFGGGSGWFGNEDSKIAKDYIDGVTKKLQGFMEILDVGKSVEEKAGTARALTQFINQYYKLIRQSLGKTSDWGDDAKEAIVAWDALKNEADEWLNRGREAPKAAPPKASPEQAAPGLASKAPGVPAQKAHRYSVKSPEVKELQQLLGVEDDGKFGQHTYDALAEAAKNYSILRPLMANKPKGYMGWENADIGVALNSLKEAKASGEQAAKQQQQKPAEQHFDASGLGIPYENEK